MRTYNVVFDKNKNKGVFGISLVENPAMEGNFIALSKQDNQIKLAEVDKDQQILIGLVLEPNKPIYRKSEKEEYNIIFNEDTIKELSHNFFINNNQSNSTLEHQEALSLDDVTFVESWIVENPEKDKSANFGLSYPKGSWIAMMKVNNDLVWDDFVKTGFVKGFSIDAMVNLEEIKLNSNMATVETNKNFWDKMKVTLNGVFSPKAEVKEEVVELEEVVAEEVVEETVEEVVETKEEDTTEQFLSELEKVLSTFKVEMQKEVAEVKAENISLKEQMVELGKKPISKPIKSAPTQVDYSEMSNYDKIKYNKENK